jgi:uncharacterized glyoxalase superfamily protein PhnB
MVIETSLKKEFDEVLTLAKRLKPLRDMRAQLQRERVTYFGAENVAKMILQGKNPAIEREKFDAKIIEASCEIDDILVKVSARFSTWSREASEWANHVSNGVVISRRLELKSLLERAASIVSESESAAVAFARHCQDLALASAKLAAQTEDHSFQIPEANSLAAFPRVAREDFESNCSSRTLLSIARQIA